MTEGARRQCRLALTRKNTKTNDELQLALFSSNDWSEESRQVKPAMLGIETVVSLNLTIPLGALFGRFLPVLSAQKLLYRLLDPSYEREMNRPGFPRGSMFWEDGVHGKTEEVWLYPSFPNGVST